MSSLAPKSSVNSNLYIIFPNILGHYKEVNVKKALKVIDDLSNDDLEINEIAFYILYILNEASKNGYIMCNEDYLEKKLLKIFDLGVFS